MAQGTKIELINYKTDEQGIDDIVNLYLCRFDNWSNPQNDPNSVILSTDFYYYDYVSEGGTVESDILGYYGNEGIIENYGVCLVAASPYISGAVLLSNAIYDPSEINLLIDGINDCSSSDTITIDCSNLSWTTSSGGSGGGGGGTTPDPEPDPSNRIATRKFVNTTPPIPQNFFTSDLDRCLRIDEVKTRPNTSKDVDYHKRNTTPTVVGRLIKQSEISFYYKTNTTSLRSNSLFIDFSGSNATMSLCEVSLNMVDHVSGRKSTVDTSIRFGSHQFGEDEEYSPSFSVPSNWDTQSFKTLNEGFNFNFNVNTNASDVRIEVRNQASSIVYTSTDPYWSMDASQYYNTPGIISIRIRMIK